MLEVVVGVGIGSGQGGSAVVVVASIRRHCMCLLGSIWWDQMVCDGPYIVRFAGLEGARKVQ